MRVGDPIWYVGSFGVHRATVTGVVDSGSSGYKVVSLRVHDGAGGFDEPYVLHEQDRKNDMPFWTLTEPARPRRKKRRPPATHGAEGDR